MSCPPPTARRIAPQRPMGLQSAAPSAVDVLSCGCSRFPASVLVFSSVRVHFVAELAEADRAEIVLLPELETRWEYLHTGDEEER
ncbi:hypothetical protein OJAV_G00081990 [Oryzias javanicus]|uniref:Uncharacterized protein n=1 Tax=Oryzias javanicus TaxID=123683 RepID=A0A3S2PLG8_ORYJA|nr:hypothetical protein OJAV_G00081990 [Oryzias javanicus]